MCFLKKSKIAELIILQIILLAIREITERYGFSDKDIRKPKTQKILHIFHLIFAFLT